MIMSEKRFLETLQALLTMVDPDSETSIACVKATITNILALAKSSQKCNHMAVYMMEQALFMMDHLILSRDDFAGRPGDYAGNTAKRQRLGLVLRPHC